MFHSRWVADQARESMTQMQGRDDTLVGDNGHTSIFRSRNNRYRIHATCVWNQENTTFLDRIVTLKIVSWSRLEWTHIIMKTRQFPKKRSCKQPQASSRRLFQIHKRSDSIQLQTGGMNGIISHLEVFRHFYLPLNVLSALASSHSILGIYFIYFCYFSLAYEWEWVSVCAVCRRGAALVIVFFVLIHSHIETATAAAVAAAAVIIIVRTF